MPYRLPVYDIDDRGGFLDVLSTPLRREWRDGHAAVFHCGGTARRGPCGLAASLHELCAADACDVLRTIAANRVTDRNFEDHPYDRPEEL
eukprot:4742177-Alexandrium_andersonii.AAC.1